MRIFTAIPIAIVFGAVEGAWGCGAYILGLTTKLLEGLGWWRRNLGA